LRHCPSSRFWCERSLPDRIKIKQGSITLSGSRFEAQPEVHERSQADLRSASPRREPTRTSVTAASTLKILRSNGSLVAGRGVGRLWLTSWAIGIEWARRRRGRSCKVFTFHRSTPQQVPLSTGSGWRAMARRHAQRRLRAQRRQRRWLFGTRWARSAGRAFAAARPAERGLG
jgi:hypothetical protein